MATVSNTKRIRFGQVRRGRKIADQTMLIGGNSSGLLEGNPRTVKFGSVVVRGYTLGSAELERNVEFGRTAVRKLKGELVRPGVTLKPAQGVPLYHADPEHPERLIRVLDGKTEHGYFEGNTFKIV
jgi:hypothetical protein